MNIQLIHLSYPINSQLHSSPISQTVRTSSRSDCPRAACAISNRVPTDPSHVRRHFGMMFIYKSDVQLFPSFIHWNSGMFSIIRSYFRFIPMTMTYVYKDTPARYDLHNQVGLLIGSFPCLNAIP